jgi:signal transduction histidine kinase
MEARIWREQQDLLHTLHDSLGQTLTGLGLMASAHAKAPWRGGCGHRRHVRQIAQHAESALGEIRQLAKGMFPTDLDASACCRRCASSATMTPGHAPVTGEGAGRQLGCAP